MLTHMCKSKSTFGYAYIVFTRELCTKSNTKSIAQVNLLPKAVDQILSTNNGTVFYIQEKAGIAEIPDFNANACDQPVSPCDEETDNHDDVTPVYLASVVIEKSFIEQIKKRLLLLLPPFVVRIKMRFSGIVEDLFNNSQPSLYVIRLD